MQKVVPTIHQACPEGFMDTARSPHHPSLLEGVIQFPSGEFQVSKLPLEAGSGGRVEVGI